MTVLMSSLQAGEKVSPIDLARQLNQAFIDVAEKVSKSVVIVKVDHKPDYIDPNEEGNPFYEMLPQDLRRQLEQQRERQRRNYEERKRRHGPNYDGRGSGVVVRKEGFILTNSHVVDGADSILVVFKDGSEFEGRVRVVDKQSDVAVIEIDPKDKELVVAKLGDSDHTRVGQFAIAIGAPFDLDYSVTFGHVSAKGRSHILPDIAADQDFIQTDANINPGNSGGPLVNIEGEVIGINTLIRGLRTGIGFAIPSNLAREVSDALIADGKFVRAYLGVRIRSLRDDPEYRQLVPDVKAGVVVEQIPPGGPAADSDLRAGDVITAVDGEPVATGQQLKNEIRSKKIGEAITLSVHRFGEDLKVKVKPAPWPDEIVPMIARKDPVPDDKAESFGLTVKPLTRETAENHGIEETRGVIVTEVERNSPAESKGIRPGDVITEVGGQSVSDLDEFRQAMKEADRKKGVAVIFTTRETSKMAILKEYAD
jgi:serine protease Do